MTPGYHDAPDPIGRIRRDLKAQRDGIANGVVDHKTAVFNALLVLEEIVNYIDSQGLTDRSK